MTQARSALSTIAAFVVLALVLGVCMGAWSVSRPPSGVAGSEGPASNPPSAEPGAASPGPSAAASLAPDALRVFAVGAIPSEHRFVFAGENGKEKLMLVLPEAGRVIEAARFEGLGEFTTGRGGDITATADGTTAVIMLEAPSGARVYIIHPVDGTVTSYRIGPADTPRISPDGTRIAYARAGTANDGVWILNVKDGTERRVVVGSGAPPRPATWSPDGRWLALTGLGGGSIGLFDTQSPATSVIGPGGGARWRGNELFFWSGPTLSAYDPAARSTRVVYDTGGATILRAELRPSSADVAAIESPQGGTAAIWLRNGANDRALRGGGNVIAMWWSQDGAKLYVWDSVEATTMVSDAFTGTPAVRFCLRGNISPPCS